MGGTGSGRYWYLGTRETTDQYLEIDVRRWQRDGLLTPGHVFGWQWLSNGDLVASIKVRVEAGQVILTYRHSSGEKAWKNESYPAQLTWTACHFGGKRPWFLCPAVGCGRRVAILHGGGVFACRRCYQLAYPSQQEADHDRAMRRADKIRERLGWRPGVLRLPGCKPKKMHWRTYERLADEYDTLVAQSLSDLSQRFSLSRK